MDEWLTHGARAYPERAAIVADGRAASCAELDAAAARAARRLAALGVRAGDRVATTLPPGLELARLLHALPRLGAVLVPLNTRLAAAERRRQVEDAAVRLLVEEPLEGEEAEVPLRASVDPGEPHSLIYTSGTTGAPKPVVLTYGNHHASALASAANLGTEPGDRWLCVLPLYHVGGLAILLRSAIYGTAAVIHPRFEEEAVLRALASGEVTLVSLVPTMLRRLLDAGLEGAPALRAALVGGGPVPRELVARAVERGLPAVPTYGMTETASQIVTARPDEAALGPAGRPLPGVELRIAHAEGEPPPGAGEVLVRGPMVAAGEIGPDGWLHTGDRGRLDGDGRLWVAGRLDEVIVTGGENVAVAQVEEALLAHPAVAEAAVVGRPDPEWGEAVTAYVVIAGEVGDAELIAHCRERLAAYKAPKAIHRVGELPRNAAGKLLRRELLG